MLLSTVTGSAQISARQQPTPPVELQIDESDDGELVDSIKRGDLAAVSRILSAGTAPDTSDDEGGLPLCWAVRLDRYDMVELLLQKGAAVNKSENEGGPALDVAATGGHAEIVKLLLAHGADAKQLDPGGHTALMTAAIGAVLKEMPPFVLQWIAGDEPSERLEQLRLHMGTDHQRVMELLLQAGAEINAQAHDCGLSALMVAALGGRADLVETLISHGAQIDLKNDDWDALNYAEAFESPELMGNFSEDEEQETKQGLLIWGQLTAPGRQQVARILRAAATRD